MKNLDTKLTFFLANWAIYSSICLLFNVGLYHDFIVSSGFVLTLIIVSLQPIRMEHNLSPAACSQVLHKLFKKGLPLMVMLLLREKKRKKIRSACGKNNVVTWVGRGGNWNGSENESKYPLSPTMFNNQFWSFWYSSSQHKTYWDLAIKFLTLLDCYISSFIYLSRNTDIYWHSLAYDWLV